MTSPIIPGPLTAGEFQLPKLEMAGAVVPGGFWYRFLALVIDSFILGFLNAPFTIFYYAALFGYGYLARRGGEFAGSVLPIFATILLYGASVVIRFFYFAWFYKNKGATPGKMIFRMRVINFENGQNIGYGKTFLREFVGKFCSALILGIGFLMVGFRQDKRGLHDLIANTQVIRRV